MCSHCMIEGVSPEGEHMDLEMYRKSLNLLKNCGSHAAMISGGEPTLHEDILDYIDLALSYGLLTMLITNGTRLNEDKPFQDEIRKMAKPGNMFLVQVTHDDRFYPNKLEWNMELKNERIEFVDRITYLFPCRRAKENNITSVPSKMYPGCFNLRSLTRNNAQFPFSLQIVEARGRFCCPSIDVDGTVRAGEVDTCHAIGTVDSELGELDSALIDMRCNNCGLVDNLDRAHLKAIGEDRLVTLK